MIFRLIPALLLLAPTAQPMVAQILELRTGEVVIGRVLEVDDHSIRFEVAFPTVSDRSIPRADITPRSIYALMSARIDQADAKAHLELSVTCRKLGLFALAIAEAREAGLRDSAYSSRVDKMIGELRGEIAAELLRHAERDFTDDRSGSARVAAHAVLRDYEDTASAKGAKRLMAKIVARVGPTPREVTAKEIETLVAGARRDLKETEKDASPPAHGSIRDQRALKRAIARLEKTWKKIGNLVAQHGKTTPSSGTTSAATPADRLSSVQADLRRRLTGAYLSLGSIYLQRRALPDADAWCNKACELDPENKHLHRLHELILQAKIAGGWGY